MFTNRLKINSNDVVWRVSRYGCLLVIAILAFATWRRYSNWPAIFDIGLWDESDYLRTGVSRTFDFGMYEWSPLYDVYYYAIGLVVHDATEVYFVGGIVIQLITLYSIGFVAWVLSRSLAIAVLVFGLTLCSPFLLVVPRVSYLAIVLMVLGVWR